MDRTSSKRSWLSIIKHAAHPWQLLPDLPLAHAGLVPSCQCVRDFQNAACRPEGVTGWWAIIKSNKPQNIRWLVFWSQFVFLLDALNAKRTFCGSNKNPQCRYPWRMALICLWLLAASSQYHDSLQSQGFQRWDLMYHQQLLVLLFWQRSLTLYSQPLKAPWWHQTPFAEAKVAYISSQSTQFWNHVWPLQLNGSFVLLRFACIDFFGGQTFLNT
jgi:hypothetical protein